MLPAALGLTFDVESAKNRPVSKVITLLKDMLKLDDAFKGRDENRGRFQRIDKVRIPQTPQGAQQRPGNASAAPQQQPNNAPAAPHPPQKPQNPQTPL